MVLTIKNFGNPVGPGVTETAPTNLVGVAGTLKATLTWTSATGESGVVWTEEKLVRKEGSAPQGSMDGTTVATITTKNTYATAGYEDTGLDNTKTYYYKAFAIYDNGTEKGSSDVSITPLAPPEEGIYWSNTLGLITIADGNGNYITIADKNLGATQVYNNGDTLSEANCGKYYQWGNNYGFSFNGLTDISTTRVNASTYGPGNYYSSSTFIKSGTNDRSTVQNDNLWGNTTNTLVARQGPCNSGFHVPTSTEVESLKALLTGWAVTIEEMHGYLKLPKGGWYDSNAAEKNRNSSSSIRTSSPTGTRSISFDDLSFWTTFRGSAVNIRPFKNEVVEPDNTWTKIYEKVTP